MGDVIRPDFDPDKDKPRFAILATCLVCSHGWMGSVVASTCLFELECPNCGDFHSFASFLPHEYLLECQHNEPEPK